MKVQPDQNAVRFYGPYRLRHQYNGHALDDAEETHLRHHGTGRLPVLANPWVCPLRGDSIAHVFDDLYIWSAPTWQILALSNGKKLRLIPAEVGGAPRSQHEQERKHRLLPLEDLTRHLVRAIGLGEEITGVPLCGFCLYARQETPFYLAF